MGPRTHEQRLAVGIWSQPKQHRDSCCDSCLTVHPLIRNKPVFAPARASATGKREVTIHLAEGRPTGDVGRLGELCLDHGLHGSNALRRRLKSSNDTQIICAADTCEPYRETRRLPLQSRERELLNLGSRRSVPGQELG
jgi:hypothetical protein